MPAIADMIGAAYLDPEPSAPSRDLHMCTWRATNPPDHHMYNTS
ncbi:hypothetical protein MSP7336_01463 [Mycobacterium shimoidei]|uniref:Uncharacterized protein n=1 Tax=Mycobacterium shimoidei TaxID=29313 RepID=A0A375YWM6_MYCSH|nr:hypothetical protein [Mycobacterium shimoidei]SRX93227.1 hypothetical protein MSP7336_01463 [Mycobacterium shimoidei]